VFTPFHKPPYTYPYGRSIDETTTSTTVSIDFTAISTNIAVSYDEEGVVLPRG
jgi:hypothetical protein